MVNSKFPYYWTIRKETTVSNRRDFMIEVLRDLDPSYLRIGLKRFNRITFLLQWTLAESGWGQCNGTYGAKFNPLNTTTAVGPASNYNNVGVKNMATFDNGVVATVATLKNGNYQEILGQIKWGTSPQKMAEAVAKSPWGTGVGVLNVQKSWNILKRRQVARTTVG